MCKTLNQLENVVADYRSLKALAEELNEQLKALERDMLDYLDSKRLEADLGSLAEYQRVSQYRRLYVK